MTAEQPTDKELAEARLIRCLTAMMNTATEGDAYILKEAIAALRTARQATSQTPDGYVLVPREPTQEMWDAATARVKANTVVIEAGPAKGSTLMRDPIAHTWYAMIAASEASGGQAQHPALDQVRSLVAEAERIRAIEPFMLAKLKAVLYGGDTK